MSILGTQTEYTIRTHNLSYVLRGKFRRRQCCIRRRDTSEFAEGCGVGEG